MSKKKVWLTVLGIALILVVTVTIWVQIQIHKVHAFSVHDYNEEIQYFEQYFYEFDECIENYQVKPVETADEAKNVAEEVWSSIYPDRAQSEKPYLVFYDEAENVWMVQGTPDYIGFGGTAGILVKADGEILAIWHGK